MEQVILVDEQDVEIGVMEKMAVHEAGLLHRAFSVLLFNSNREILLQRRADGKYHSAGLWTNTCCSHPMPGEPVITAAHRRLSEEMGIRAELEFAFKFVYNVKLDSGLRENELDHVLIGIFDGEPVINKQEVSDWKFESIRKIQEDIERQPEQYTQWFKLILKHPEFLKTIPEITT